MVGLGKECVCCGVGEKGRRTFWALGGWTLLSEAWTRWGGRPNDRALCHKGSQPSFSSSPSEAQRLLSLPQEGGQGGPNGALGVPWNLDFSGGSSSAFFPRVGKDHPVSAVCGLLGYGGEWGRGGAPRPPASLPYRQRNANRGSSMARPLRALKPRGRQRAYHGPSESLEQARSRTAAVSPTRGHFPFFNPRTKVFRSYNKASGRLLRPRWPAGKGFPVMWLAPIR